MAKYGRFDPRNKKNNRNKQRSIYKDIRIRMVEEKERRKNWSNTTWLGTDNDIEDELEDDYND